MQGQREGRISMASSKNNKKAPWWWRFFFGSPGRTMFTGIALVVVWLTNLWAVLLTAIIVALGLAVIFGWRPFK